MYGYAFPAIFLVVFWVIYRHETVPIARHLGELLTVTALGGACFGLPTAMVSERERGVWRKVRATPISAGILVTATLAARYVLLLTAALMQVALANLLFGMPFPPDPMALVAAFTLVAFAFLGLGLVIAMVADTVPAVQALGQCLFLPMLIIGGVAVRLESLPLWAQHISAYFPGRYAVAALHGPATGSGLHAVWYELVALVLIGIGGYLAGVKLFRWDVGQRFFSTGSPRWLAVSVATWLAVGVIAQATGRVVPIVPAVVRNIPTRPAPSATTTSPPAPPGPTAAALDATRQKPSGTPAPAAQRDSSPAPATGMPTTVAPDTAWQSTTVDEMRALDYASLPPDGGVVSPLAGLAEPVPDDMFATAQCMRNNLPRWEPAAVADPVQRTRNLLYIAAVPDIFQLEEFERWVPRIVYEFLQQQKTTSWDDQMKILYWIATHPEEGDTAASAELGRVCLEMARPGDVEMLRERTRFYAMKLLGRMLGVLAL